MLKRWMQGAAVCLLGVVMLGGGAIRLHDSAESASDDLRVRADRYCWSATMWGVLTPTG